MSTPSVQASQEVADPGPPVALVTGAARGIGRTIADRFAEAGYRIAIADLDISPVQAAKPGHGDQPGAFQVDVSSTSDVAALRTAVEQRYGRLDVLVNNAGGSAHTPLAFDEVTQEHYDRVMDWNVRGTFLMCQSMLTLLQEAQGCIVNIASVAGRAGLPIVSVQYSAAKAAIIGLTRTLAAHVGPRGVRVNVVAPGFIRSGERADQIWQTRNTEHMIASIPLRRRGETREIADACLMLASPAGSYITGAVIDVNGGYLAV